MSAETAVTQTEKKRPALDGWIVLPAESADGVIRAAPECVNGHPFISYKMHGQVRLEWRGDAWIVLTCQKCHTHSFGYLSTGPRPMVHMWPISGAQSEELLRLDFDTTAAEVMLRLGYATMPARPSSR